MQTIAQQRNIKSFPFEIKDTNGKLIYFEYSKGYWYKFEYDINGNLIYYENSNGYWNKWEYDANDNQIYFEDSIGTIIDNRPTSTKEYSMDEIPKALNIPVNQLKIKK
jgi:hypothetical protein